jgi:hypothetical protein
VPFTNDFERCGGRWWACRRAAARGATNFAAGIRLAITELAGLPGAQSTPREARKIILFLTDGRRPCPSARATCRIRATPRPR